MMGRRLFAFYYLYCASHEAAATTSVANQLSQRAFDALNNITLHLFSNNLFFLCLNI